MEKKELREKLLRRIDWLENSEPVNEEEIERLERKISDIDLAFGEDDIN